jgi:hypothetical protein
VAKREADGVTDRTPRRSAIPRVNEDTGLDQPSQQYSVVAKPRTAIVRNIFVSVGICARNSIIRQHDSISLLIFWLKALTSSPAPKRACAIRL